ncbi:MAG: hypothetical protein QOF14_1253 [Hyphomicrobiales bacterium]|nr:hypothetical protein [Hyphomicrobiales bacterium]
MPLQRVDQSQAHAQRDIVGRDLNQTTNNYAAPQAAGVIEQLLVKLHHEMEQDVKVRDTIERLQRFYTQRAHDGINGLQAKLTAGGRESSYLDAIEMKEMFAKLLERWSLYASAQQIFVHLLARAERQFNDVILPQLGVLDVTGGNKLVFDLIVEPTVTECGASVFEIDHNTAMGMIYWLAEQCFVRWHK